MLRKLALASPSEKGLAEGLLAAAIVFGAIKFANTGRSGSRAVSQEQLAELKAQVDKIERDLQSLKAHIFSILDEQTALTFASGVYGVGQAVRSWVETEDATAAKGALGLVETLHYRFVTTLGDRPDFLSDETVVVLGQLFNRHMSFRLTIHALNNLESWSDDDADALRKTVPKIAKNITSAQQNLRAANYSFCLGVEDSEFEPPAGDGEPIFSWFTQEYGLTVNDQQCEILGKASWSAYAVNPRGLSQRLRRAMAEALADARERVTSEIMSRALEEAKADLSTEMAFLDLLIEEDEVSED